MPIELDILKQVCCLLDDYEIPYMLTGSFAANFYAVPRMTRDIDIVIEIQMKEAEKISQTFKDKFYVDKIAINNAIEHQDIFNIIHNEHVFKIDFIISTLQNFWTNIPERGKLQRNEFRRIGCFYPS
jgi:hypothetical protein